VEFLTFANYVDLLGPFDSVVELLGKIMSHIYELQSKHIKMAMECYDEHPFRVRVLEIIANLYMEHMIHSHIKKKESFRYQYGLDEYPDLKLIVLEECTKCFTEKLLLCPEDRNHKKFVIRSPDDKTYYKLTTTPIPSYKMDDYKF
jgi:hypothetical protein